MELPQNAIRAIKGSELEAASLPAQVGGTIVHVLGWKEGVAILPGSNLKVSVLRLRKAVFSQFEGHVLKGLK